MRRLLTVGILSIFCSSLGACAPERLAVSLRPDLDNPSRLICEAAPASRPERGAPHEIDWSKVLTVAEAKIQHGLYVARERERNGAVAAYVLEIEGRLFTCSNNAQWWRDYWARIPAPAKQ